jgi:Zn-dependent alcohol dehydrogenase
MCLQYLQWFPDENFIDIYTLLGCALSTAYGIVKNEISLEEVNKHILIIGAGGVGLSLNFWLRVLGFQNVTFYDKSESKRDKITVSNYQYFSERERENLFNGIQKYDVCIDTTGNNDLISNGFSLLSKQASLILVGQTKKGTDLVLRDSLKIFDGIKIWASDGGRFNPDSDILEMMNILKSNLLEANKLITDKVTLDEINDAFVKLDSGDAGRILITF